MEEKELEGAQRLEPKLPGCIRAGADGSRAGTCGERKCMAILGASGVWCWFVVGFIFYPLQVCCLLCSVPPQTPRNGFPGPWALTQSHESRAAAAGQEKPRCCLRRCGAPAAVPIPPFPLHRGRFHVVQALSVLTQPIPRRTHRADPRLDARSAPRVRRGGRWSRVPSAAAASPSPAPDLFN